MSETHNVMPKVIFLQKKMFNPTNFGGCGGHKSKNQFIDRLTVKPRAIPCPGHSLVETHNPSKLSFI